MKLKSIELLGFKSFPDKTKITFSEGVTGIIGPNGSGKSNISDAVRWVLGEMSLKSLRGSKMEDVIFAGAKDRKPANYTYVSITFDTSEEYDRARNEELLASPNEEEEEEQKPVSQLDGEETKVKKKPDFKLSDGPETVITRKYYRSGESEYYINKRRVRLKDLYELFYDTGIGREGYSVISQGKISEVLSRKGDERRSIFEEAAGISKIRYKKQEAEKKLYDTQQNLLRINDILSEVSSRVEPLRKEAENAEKYLVLAEEKAALEITLWLDRIDKLKSELERAENSRASAKLELDSASDELSKAEAGLDEMINASYELSRNASETERKLGDLAGEKSAGEGEEAVLNNDIGHYRSVLDDFDGKMKTLSESKALAESKYNDTVAEIKNTENEIGEKTEEYKKLTERHNEIVFELNERLFAVNEAENKQAAVFAEKGEIQTQIALCDSKAEDFRTGNADRERKMQFSMEKIESLKKQRDEKSAELEKINGQIEELKSEFESYQTKVNELKEAVKSENEKLISLRVEMNSAEQRKDNFVRMENLLEGYSDGVKRVMKDAKSGALNIPLCTAVSRIIGADEKYTTALEIALGGAVQFLAVETQEDAKAAVAHLKKNKAGRATFLPLDTVKGKLADVSAIENMPGYIGIASELAVYEDKYSGIVRELLGRTIVTENLDYAAQVARKANYRLKIVTLDGQLVNPGGSITGGSGARRVGVFSRNADIENLTAEIKKLQKSCDTAQKNKDEKVKLLSETEAKINENRNAYTAIRERREEATAELRRCEALYESETENSEILFDEKNNSQSVIDGIFAQKKEFEKKLESLSAQYETAQNNSQKAKQELEDKRNEEKQSLENLSAARYASASLGESLTRLSGLKDEYFAEAKERSAAVIELNEAAKQAREGIERCNEKLAVLTEKKKLDEEREKALKEQSESISEEMTKLEKKTSDLRLGIKELSAHKEDLFRSYTGLCSKTDYLNGEYESVTNKLWDEYEMTYSAAAEHRLPSEQAQKAAPRLASIKAKLRAMGHINVNAPDEYRETKERFDFLTEQTEDLNKTGRSLDNAIGRLNAEMKTAFTDSFEKISAAFSDVFCELFGGGSARLELEDPDNPLECGIDIIIRPPGKSVKSISLLSGGEQSFAAIALYLALQKINPSPFCIFDEIESALDDVNLARFADYVRVHSDKTQYILITHRRGTMERADTLYGVTMKKKGISDYIMLDISELDDKMKEYAAD